MKLPKDKPPFIGILFERDWEGQKLNCDLVEESKHHIYSLEFEICNGHLNLRLMCPDILTVRIYAHLKYDPEKFKAWLYMVKKASTYNFGHVFSVKDQHVLLKSYNKKYNFVLKANKCSVVEEQDDKMYV
ncbi:MAG: hypothetical protein ACXVHT_01300 [Methanobacterium sp.]